MSMSALLAWTHYGSEFIIHNIKNASKFAEYLKCNFNAYFLTSWKHMNP